MMIHKKIIVLAFLLLLPCGVFAQSTVPQGGTGTTTVPAGWFLKGSTAIRLTASQFINLLSDVTGILSVANGGTGSSTLSGILKGNGTGIVQTAVPGTDYQAPGNYITALTGDVTASGPGSVAATLASIITAGSCTNCNLTYDAKGRLTVASNGASGGGGSIGTSTPLVAGQVDFSTGVNTIGNDSAFLWDSVLDKLTVTNASTTNLSIGSLTGFLKAVGGIVSTALVNLASDVTGTLPIANGGTGTSTPGIQGQNVIIGSGGVYTATSTIFTTLANAVGIGTQTPAGKVDIQGTSTASTGQALDVWDSAATNLFRVRNDGSVGVGVVAPLTKLDVNGTARVQSTLYFGSTFNGSTPTIRTSNNANIDFGQNGSAQMRLDESTGFFGIATATPARALSVQGNGLFSGDVSVANLTATGTVQSAAFNRPGTTDGCATWASSLLTSTGVACGAGSVTSVTGTYPIISSGGATPAISVAFGTTTSNTWAGTQTFTNSPVFSTLGAGTVNSTAAGTVYNTGTSTPTVTAPITYSGTLGQFIGGVSGTFDCVAATGSVKGCLTAADWTTFNGKLSAAITALGPTGQTQTGATQTLASSTSTTNGLTSAITIVGSGNTQTFTPSLSGTLTVPGGGTGATSFTSSNLLYGAGTGAVQSVATTSATCSGSASCTPFTVIGTSPIVISASAGAGAYPFTPTSNFAVVMSATSTPLWARAGLYASSSTAYPTLAVTQAGAGPSATFNGGSVGVGTVAPGHLLDVAGDIGIQGALYDTINSAGTNGDVLQSVGTGGFNWVPVSSLGVITGSGVSGRVAYYNGASSITSTSGFTFDGTNFAAPGTITGAAISRTGTTDGCATWASNLLISTGSACGSGGGGTYPFTPATNYGVGMSATTTGLWAKGGLYASSSTAYPTFAVRQAGAGPAATFDGGNVGIGSTSPSFSLAVNGVAAVNGLIVGTTTMGNNVTDFGTNGLGNAIFNWDSRNILVIGAHGPDAVSAAAGINTYSSRGTSANPTASVSGDQLYFMGARGYGATDYGNSSKAAVILNAAQNWTDTNQGTYITLETTPNNSITRAERLRVDQSGNVGIGSTTPGTLLSLGNTGANTINLSATATSTFGSGINISTGCYAVGGTCLSTSGGGYSPVGTTGQVPVFTGTNTLTATSTLSVTANSRVGVGSSTPFSLFAVDGLNVQDTSKALFAVKAGPSNGGDLFQLLDSAGGKTVYINQFGNLMGQGINGSQINANLNVGSQTGLNINGVFGGGGTVNLVQIDKGDGFGYVFINKYAQLMVGTTTSPAMFTAATSSNGTLFKPQLLLTDQSGGTNTKHWGLASEKGNLTFNAMTDAYATTTRMVITNAGNVGIGTSTPGFKLEVNGDLGFTIPTVNGANKTINFGQAFGNPALVLYDSPIANSDWGWGLQAGEMQFYATNSGGNHYSWNTGGALQTSGTNELMRLDVNGNLSLGTTAVLNRLNVNGAAAIGSYAGANTAPSNGLIVSGKTGIGTSTPTGTALSTNGTNYMAGLTTSAGTQQAILCQSTTNEVIAESVACVASAKRYKENIKDSDAGLSTLMKLRAAGFTWKKDYLGDRINDPNWNGPQLSLIADEVQKVDPRLVFVTTGTTTWEGKEYAPGTVNGLADMNHWAALFVKSIQEQQAQIDALKTMKGMTRSAEENWQWIAIGLLLLWNLALTVRRRK